MQPVMGCTRNMSNNAIYQLKHYNNISTLKFAICSLLLAICTSAYAQQHKTIKEDTAPVDSIDLMMARIDSLVTADSIINMTANKDERSILQVDSTKRIKAKRDWSTWKPDPQRALWLALVLPGAGQIYNRKYWKLPIVYGGFMGCIYAMTWNNMMYKD